MRLIKKSPEVYLAEGEIASIGQREIDLLKTAVTATPLKRVRINLHPSSEDELHEMFIVLQQGSYVRPHKHPNKSEAFHAVYGSAQVVIFDDEGNIKQVVHLDADKVDKPFYYRMSKPYFHTLIVQSELFIVHEITNGPFVPGGTIFAPFAPDDSDLAAVNSFSAHLAAQINKQETP